VGQADGHRFILLMIGSCGATMPQTAPTIPPRCFSVKAISARLADVAITIVSMAGSNSPPVSAQVIG
jgi:hypothetical protein